LERADALIGARLDKDYEVKRRIGVGGMSIVYLVEHTRLHKEFAAKLLHAELAVDAEAVARFETEAKSASHLEHENIVRVTDYGIAGGQRPYIVMELLRGRTLDEQLAEGALSLPEIVLVVVSVCRGLALAHANEIIHRDIKPDNIYLTQRTDGGFGVKILDFGIAKAPMTTGRMTKHGQTIGTPHYMAPEACRGEEIDHRADIYSVGVLMYLLFTGALPHHDDNFLRLLQKHVLDPVAPPSRLNPEITPAIEEVILHAIAKDPDDRYLSVEHLLSEFELALPVGANALLATNARVSTPIPRLATHSLGTAPVRAPTTRTPVHSRLSAVMPVAVKPRSRRPLVLALLALLGGTIVAIVLVTTRRSEPDAKAAPATPPIALAPPPTAPPASPPHVETPPAPATPAVKLQVTSRPTRALIRMNGSDLGRTPLAVDVPAADTAALEISADGYQTERRTVALRADQSFEVVLARVRVASPPPVVPHPPVHPHPPTTPAVPPPPNDLEIRTHR